MMILQWFLTRKWRSFNRKWRLFTRKWWTLSGTHVRIRISYFEKSWFPILKNPDMRLFPIDQQNSRSADMPLLMQKPSFVIRNPLFIIQNSRFFIQNHRFFSADMLRHSSNIVILALSQSLYIIIICNDYNDYIGQCVCLCAQAKVVRGESTT